MGRIRTIKPGFFRHFDLYTAERETGLPLRVAFAGLWTAADREGRFKWRPDELKLDCLPFDPVDFSRVLHALTTRGFIRRYTANGRAYGCIPSWSRHQVINNRESPSELPEAPTADESVTSTREPRVDDACPTPLVHAQAEGEQEGEQEGNGNGTGRGVGTERAPRVPATMRAPRVMPGSSAAWDSQHGRHTLGFCDWFCLPADVFGQLATRLGGEAEAMAFAKRVRGRFESSVPKGVPSGRPWEFWERQLAIEFPPEAAPSRTPDALAGVREALRRV